MATMDQGNDHIVQIFAFIKLHMFISASQTRVLQSLSGTSDGSGASSRPWRQTDYGCVKVVANRQLPIILHMLIIFYARLFKKIVSNETW